MLSPAEVERLADSLAQLGLEPVTHFNVILCIGRALSDDAGIPASGLSHRATNSSAPHAKPRGRPKRAPLPLAEEITEDEPPTALLPQRYAKEQSITADTKHAVSFLRGTLSGGPRPASDIEEAAERKGIGRRSLERARETLNVHVERRGDGQGVCYALPSQAANGAAAEAD